MFSNLLRIFGARTFKPLKFTNKNAEYIDTDVDDIGLYIHIPFCRVLCPFCPYNKVKYNKELAMEFKEAIIKEINLIGEFYKSKKVTSVYFGGGTPSIIVSDLAYIIATLKDVFTIRCDIGIELHPRDVTEELLKNLKGIGFTMVSLGVQSFQRNNLKTLGREYVDGESVVKLAKKCGFKVIDIDLIFGIKGQTEEQLRKDFNIAFKSGATQVSTYPFIDFSYANNYSSPLGRKQKKSLLNCLEKVSSELNLSRTSVWTFGKTNLPKYSSITRDTYLGFGPSAATLTNKSFKINTFSVEEYIKSLKQNKNPKALTMNFTPRLRALYWGFWNAYTLELNRFTFKKLFNKEIEDFFTIELLVARAFKLIIKTENGYKLTSRGTYLYHLIEQHYTHQYIDKTWRTCGETAWPKEIKLY